MCSFSITSASAEVTVLQLSPRMFRPESATMKPRDSAMSTMTSVGSTCSWCGAHEAPNGINSLWFQPGCEAQGCQGCFGSSRAAIS